MFHTALAYTGKCYRRFVFVIIVFNLDLLSVRTLIHGDILITQDLLTRPKICKCIKNSTSSLFSLNLQIFNNALMHFVSYQNFMKRKIIQKINWNLYFILNFLRYLKYWRIIVEVIFDYEFKPLDCTFSAYSGPTASLPVRSLTEPTVRSLSNNGSRTAWMDQLSARIEYPYVREMYWSI